MSKAPTFQSIVFSLQHYWSDQGCLIWLPTNIEVGAGTMNPATFLHVLGPEPWNVAYVEPSLRPDDARYGKNPNRLGKHHQFQVILKPDPGDPQQLYLDSLSAVGIDLARHDVRFVEDNWESPALGAWGLGWEVWLDGLEITQFTYFQQAGSLDLEPVSIEITYGLDRILMALQDVDHFKDIRWNDRITLGDLQSDYEAETSRYYFENADIDRLQRLFDLYEEEAEHALESGLVRIAHDYVLKCSHAFNVLDARGTVGVTERARFFARMRALARRVASGWVERRRESDFPLLADDVRGWAAGALGQGNGGGGADAYTADAMASDSQRGAGRIAGAPPTAPTDLVVEIGTEELPPGDVEAALDYLRSALPNALADARLRFGSIEIQATPRRLVMLVTALAAAQTDIEEDVVGPPSRAAFDEQGRPTRAAEGFARSVGVDPSALRMVERGGEERVAATRREAGRLASDVLVDVIPRLIAATPAARSMRWNDSGQTFSRPVRWLLAMHGEHVVPIRFAGLDAGRITRGVRPLGSRQHSIVEAADYPKLMRSLGIILDPAARAQSIVSQIEAAAIELGGEIGANEALLGEVVQLVEQPKAVGGTFDPRFLELPNELLVGVMRKHQRYFAVHGSGGDLLPAFVTVANGAALDSEAVRHGNEGVLRARFADAAYFWELDGAQPLEAYRERLERLTFQADLGSMLDKTRRLELLVGRLADGSGADVEAIAVARRAAELSKCDLATAMVIDFTSLQGVMGREYALRSGEPAAVAVALYEQYLPRGAGDDLPSSEPGTLLAMADRLDSLVGLFAVGKVPSGAQDQYGLRRAAMAIVRILVEGRLDLALSACVDAAAAGLPVALSAEAREAVLTFLGTRFEGQLRAEGLPADVVSAVLCAVGDHPARAAASARTLAERVAAVGWTGTLTAFARCARIVAGQGGDPAALANTFDSSLLAEPAEYALAAAVDEVEDGLNRVDIALVLDALSDLAPVIDAFFEAVLVMAEEPAVRANRLALLARIVDLTAEVVDLSRMEGF